MESIICIFDTYQTFITGLLGFTSVILTMIYNAKNQRNLQTNKIAHDTQSLRVAIKSELVANKKSYENRIQQFKEPSSFSDALIPNNVVDKVYRTLLDRIGLLTKEEIEIIIDTYMLLEDLPYRLRILVGMDNVGGHDNEFIRLKGDNISIAAKMHESFLPNIVKAIDEIDNKIKTSK